MTGLLVRLALRYLSGALIMLGLSDADAQFIAADPAVISGITIAAGTVLGFTAEAWYGLAKRFGWKT
jgi:hypothetical protein